jgi:hypothetical protein
MMPLVTSDTEKMAIVEKSEGRVFPALEELVKAVDGAALQDNKFVAGVDSINQLNRRIAWCLEVLCDDYDYTGDEVNQNEKAKVKKAKKIPDENTADVNILDDNIPDDKSQSESESDLDDNIPDENMSADNIPENKSHSESDLDLNEPTAMHVLTPEAELLCTLRSDVQRSSPQLLWLGLSTMMNCSLSSIPMTKRTIFTGILYNL